MYLLNSLSIVIMSILQLLVLGYKVFDIINKQGGVNLKKKFLYYKSIQNHFFFNPGVAYASYSWSK
jgi:hypothetical protein